MAKIATPLNEEQSVKSIQPGTPEMEAYLAIGYPRIGTRAKAEKIIKERKETPALWPYEMVEEAEAFLAALDGRSIAISTKPGWKRQRSLA